MKAPASKAAKTGKPTTKGAAARTSSAAPKPGSAAKTPAKATVKAPVKAATRTVKPATKAVSKPAAKPAAKAAAKPSAKPAAKAAVSRAPAKAPAKPAVKSSAKTSVKAPVKPAAKAPAKAPVKAAAKAAATPAKAPVKTPPTKAATTKAASAKAAPAKAAPVKSVAPAPAPRTAVKPVATKPPVSSVVKASPAPADKVHAAPPPAAIEPTPRPLGKRAAKKVMMEQMTQAEVVPTHAPDAAKATFSPTIARVMTPPVPSSIQKDPKRANNWKTLPVDQLTDQDIQAMPESEYMGEVQLAFFRRKLQQLKADMLANAGETTEHLREDTVVVPDPADRATIEEEHALELRTRDRERKLLKKIEQAIARIDAGDYGYCEETGEPIGVARLMARPTASLSLEAQQRRELKQKMFGD